MSKAARQHWFKHFRAWQRKVSVESGGGLTVYPSGRTERTFASAPYGEHALSAWESAKAQIHFRARLKEMVK